MREEIFGPVVAAMPFDDDDEIAAPANDTAYAASPRRLDARRLKAHRTPRRCRPGRCGVNTYHIYDAALPFGGYKQSGWGREMGARRPR